MSEDLNKLAATTIKTLQKELNEINSAYSNRMYAEKLAFSLFNDGNIAADELEEKIEELSRKDSKELEIIKTASLMSRSSNNPFKLSNSQNDLSGVDNLTAYLMGGIYS